MNKKELIKKVSGKVCMSKLKVSEIVDTVFDEIEYSLAEGNEVSINGFGSFKVHERAPRKGRNPKTGEEIDIEAKRLPVFKAGKTFKDVVS